MPNQRQQRSSGPKIVLQVDIDEQVISLNGFHLRTHQILRARPFGPRLGHNIGSFELDGNFADWLLILPGALRLKGCCCKAANHV